MREPFVSCIMPTRDRRSFVRAAIECFLQQSYGNSELIILDDGVVKITDLVALRKHPSEPPSRIRYIKSTPFKSLGEKRNACCMVARGEIICHFDDDDWSAEDRVEDQVKRLLATGAPVTGYSRLLFWDCIKGVACWYRARVPGYVVGTSLCYWRDFWRIHRFTDKPREDNEFIRLILGRIACSSDHRHMVARIHDCHHASPKQNITEIAPRELIPTAFWKNEKLRIS